MGPATGSHQQDDYVYMITLHRTAMPILEETLLLLAVKKQAAML